MWSYKKYTQSTRIVFRWSIVWLSCTLFTLVCGKQFYIVASLFCPKFLIPLINFSPDNLHTGVFGFVLSLILSPVIVTTRMVMASVSGYKEHKGAIVLLPSQYEEFKKRIGELAENENLRAMFVVGEDALAEPDGFLCDAAENSSVTTHVLISDTVMVEQRAKNLFDNNAIIRRTFRNKFEKCKEHFLRKAEKTDSFLHQLEARNGYVEHRHYSFYPSWRILLFNSAVFVQSYKTGINSRDTIARIYKKRDPRYESFKNYFDNTWASQEKINNLP